MSKKKKVRVELRKNRSKPPRENDLTRAFQEGDGGADDAQTTERVRAKGDLSRYRTVVQDAADESGKPSVDAACVRGRVLRVHGLASVVEADDGRIFRCAVRRLLKSLATDERNVVTTGDIVWVRPAREESGRTGERVKGKDECPEVTPSPAHPFTPSLPNEFRRAPRSPAPSA
jgi:ribosome biogenesis GTPase